MATKRISKTTFTKGTISSPVRMQDTVVNSQRLTNRGKLALQDTVVNSQRITKTNLYKK